LPNEDEWVGKLLAREFKKLGINSQTSQKVTGVETSGEKAVVKIEGQESIQADKVLVSVGRKAVCDKETIDNISLEMDGSVIKVNKKMETNIDGVYAIGDVVGTTFLAHGAFAEAEVAAANIMGEDEQMKDYNLIPRAVYSFPEVASVGKNEARCEKEGIECEVGKAQFKTNGRSVAHNDNVGEVRVIKSKGNGKIKGITMVGAEVTELIASARALLGSREQITDVSFAHPTVSEVLKEAWEDAYGLSIHVPPRKMKK
jgi:dihydrolipoamide dehydrogenase